MMRGKILLVDDEIEVRQFLQIYFEDRDFKVEVASDGIAALDKFQKGSFDLVVCDMLMPKMIGTELLRKIKELKPDQRVIMMTAVKEDSMVQKSKALGCLHYLTKPLRLSDLEARVAECLPSG